MFAGRSLLSGRREIAPSLSISEPISTAALSHSSRWVESEHAAKHYCRALSTRILEQCSQPCSVIASHASTFEVIGRRSAVLSSLATLWFSTLAPSRASILKSVKSERPGALTLRNDLEAPARIYWINYDGDPEFFAALPPGGYFTIDTYETHPWRIINAADGSVVRDYIATAGEQEVSISEDPLKYYQADRQGELQVPQPPSEQDWSSFDGIGGGSADYAAAQLDAVTINMDGGIATLRVEGYPSPMPLFVGVAEAAAILYASGMEFRRPSTVNAWRNSLKAAGASVKRILVTRLVGNTYYARILLSLPGGAERSIDARPSDSLALALQCAAPVYVAKQIASNQAAAPLEKLLQDEHGRQLGPGMRSEELHDAATGLEA